MYVSPTLIKNEHSGILWDVNNHFFDIGWIQKHQMDFIDLCEPTSLYSKSIVDWPLGSLTGVCTLYEEPDCKVSGKLVFWIITVNSLEILWSHSSSPFPWWDSSQNIPVFLKFSFWNTVIMIRSNITLSMSIKGLSVLQVVYKYALKDQIT